MISKPLTIYINWASYDELSDAVELDESLALRQFDELLRLRRAGVSLDCYLMDAFWYEPTGGYRTWRRRSWPNGPDRWLDLCREHGVMPGMWFQANSMAQLEVIEPWRDSHDPDTNALCLFQGGYLAHLLESFAHWYGRGVRVFKIDFANFDAAPPAVKASLLPHEIRASNIAAFRAGLGRFKAAHPEAIFLAYNGIEELNRQTDTGHAVRKVIDLRWLDVYDALYCGDPRPADVPAVNFWRSKDVYSDHMVRYYAANGVPLHRIDNSGFMIGTTGTCYGRGKAAWKGMLLLSLARGGWANTYYGNLDLLTSADASWFAKAQRMWLPIQASGNISAFGGMPGNAVPYGFRANTTDGSTLLTLVNPSQSVATVHLPTGLGSPARILFRDAGLEPQLSDGNVTLGPEQMAVVGTGKFASAEFDLGVQHDVEIAPSSAKLATVELSRSPGQLTVEVRAEPGRRVGLFASQRDAKTRVPIRTTGGAPPNGTTLGKLLELSVTDAATGHAILTGLTYDKAIWSGLSWAATAVTAPPSGRLHVTFRTPEKQAELTVDAHG